MPRPLLMELPTLMLIVTELANDGATFGAERRSSATARPTMIRKRIWLPSTSRRTILRHLRPRCLSRLLSRGAGPVPLLGDVFRHGLLLAIQTYPGDDNLHLLKDLDT